MNKFSINRFVAYAQSELISNRRMLLTLLASVFAYVMIIFYFYYLAQSTDGNSSSNAQHSSLMMPTMVSWFSIIIFCVVYTSVSFKKYYEKGFAVSSLMLPVSQIEKFTFALLFNTIIMPLALAGIVSIVSFCWSLGYGLSWNFTIFKPRETFDLAIFVYANISIYFFGAIFFRRNHFLYTMIALFTINTILGYTGFLIAQLLLWWHPDMTWLETPFKVIFENGMTNAKYIIEAIGIGFILLMWRVSWVRFRNLQINK